jgi:hypothetical protein
MIEPFPGPRPYTIAEKHLFRGRDEEIRDLRDLICAYPLVLLYSQSGAGKSSLLEAGLRPLLEAEPGDFVTTRIGFAANKDSVSDTSNVFIEGILRNAFSKYSGTGDLKTLLTREGPRRHVLVVDQLEELFTLFTDRWEQREGFLVEIANAIQANPELRVLFVIREEYLGQLVAYSDLLPLNLQIRYRLERLKSDAALEAIQKPLQSYGVSTDQEAVARLVDNLRLIRVRVGTEVREIKGEFVEPVHLQVVCQDLWDNCPKPCAKIDLPEKLDGVDSALQRFYESAVKQTVSETHVREGRIRKWFDERVITSSGTRRVLFREESVTDGLPNRVVDSLENKHIVRSEPRATEQTCELTHDRLIGPIRRSNDAFRRRRRVIIWPLYVLLICVAMFFIRSWIHQNAISRRRIRDQAAQKAETIAGESDLRYASKLALSTDIVKQRDARAHYASALAHFINATEQFLHLEETSSGDELISEIAFIGVQRGPFGDEARQFLENVRGRHSWDHVSLTHIEMGLAELDYQSGRTQESLDHLKGLDRSLLTASETARVDEIEGLALVRSGQFDAAENDFRQGLNTAQIDDASSRYNLRLDLGISKNARSDYKGAVRTLEQMLIGRDFKETAKLHIFDPPSLLRELGTAYSGMHRLDFGKTQFWNALREPQIETYNRALVLLAFVRADIEADYKKTKEDMDRVNQAIAALDDLSTKEHPYDPVALGAAIAFKARLHTVQASRKTNDTRDAQCASLDGSGELRCAAYEVKLANELWQNAQYRWGVAFNDRTIALIESAQGRR